MADIPGWDSGIHEAIRDLIGFVGLRLDLLTTARSYPQSRQIGAAYLARTRRLVIAMDLLYEAGASDLIGGPLRICLESWITGMWVLVVGQPALDILLAHYQATSNKLIKNAGLGLELFEDIEDAPQLPNVADRTLAVEKLLVAEGDAIAGQVLWSYRLVYGGESQEGIHAGLAAVLGHLDDTDERPWVGVHAQRREAGDGAGKVLWATTLLVILARRVFLAYGISTDELDELAAPIQRLAHDLNGSQPLPPDVPSNS